MGKITVKALVEGGNAKAGPPLGPTLGQHKVNIGKVISEINEKTKEFKGIQVPVDIVIDTETKEFTTKVGLPPVSSLIKKELGLKKLGKNPWKEDPVGNLTFDQVIKFAKLKIDNLGTRDLKGAVKQVLGTCLSSGITVEGKNPKEVAKEVDEGKWNNEIKA